MHKQFLKTFLNKNILVTGGTGSIGSEIVKQLIEYKPKQIRIYSRDESKQFNLQQDLKSIQKKLDIRFLIGDIRDKERFDKAFWNIDIVFHAAALKHVPFCEYNPFEAIKTNVLGTQNLIDLSIKHNVKKVIAISTDKAVDPINILGTTKLLMEKMILTTRWYLGSAKTKFSIVRFGNVLDSRGSALPLWKDQIQKGGPLTITDPTMTRYVMVINDAVKLVFKAAFLMHGQEIFILKMSKRKIIDLAQEILHKYDKNIKKKIKIKITGKRDGEKIHEKLFSDEEEQSLIDLHDMYVLLPEDIRKKRSLKLYKFHV